jgi:alkanesulfonate monooxygenase SsuD/methylene tetrahydromethanopterin reductase-like flavin-dependent oxidoreductase (luciferase family)
VQAGDRETALRFGISIVPATETATRSRELVRAADEAGLDLVGIQDHPYQRRFLVADPGASRPNEARVVVPRRCQPAAASACRDGQSRCVIWTC